MFRERNEWPSTAGGLPAEERSGYMELCEVTGQILHVNNGRHIARNGRTFFTRLDFLKAAN